MSETFTPLRNLRDIEELERVPLEQRIFSWNLNDWIARGCALDPRQDRASATSPTATPTAHAVTHHLSRAERRGRPGRQPVPLARRRPDDAVLYRAADRAAALRRDAGRARGRHRLRRQLDAQAASSLGELIRSTGAKVDRRARADARLRDLGEPAGDPRRDSAWRAHPLGAGAGRQLPIRNPTSTRSLPRQPGDRLTFARKVAPDDIAAYVHSGGTTGSPKLVKLTHRGFSYKCWANAVVMAHTADDVIFADYPMFHIAGIFGRGISPSRTACRS